MLSITAFFIIIFLSFNIFSHSPGMGWEITAFNFHISEHILSHPNRMNFEFRPEFKAQWCLLTVLVTFTKVVQPTDCSLQRIQKWVKFSAKMGDLWNQQHASYYIFKFEANCLHMACKRIHKIESKSQTLVMNNIQLWATS